MRTFKFVVYIAKPGEAMTAEAIKKAYKKYAAGTKQKKSRAFDEAVLDKLLVIERYASKIEKFEAINGRFFPGVAYVSDVVKGDWEIDPKLIEGL